MSAKPYTAEELAELRMGASEGLAGPTVSRALATIDAVTAERNEVRLRLAQAEEARDVERAGAMHAQLESSELREAARALLADLENNDSDAVMWCEAHADSEDEYCCLRPATQKFLYDSLCDEHAAEHIAEHPRLELRPRDLSYAPALRRLRALVEVKP